MGSKKILSYGGGLQTTALAILVKQGKVQIDEAVFVDTGAEKPETYWYMEHYIKPLFAEAEVLFTCVPGVDSAGNLTQKCQRYRIIPSINPKLRWCTDKHKVTPLHRYLKHYEWYPSFELLIGFSLDEERRSQRDIHVKNNSRFPLIELGLDSEDCRQIIREYGYPLPLKSSCFYCPFQRPFEWNWLKSNHPELIEAALNLEKAYHERLPHNRQDFGVFCGKPLWKWLEGIQMEMPILEERSCWSGHCGH